ncbi:MAG: PAS domain S-box protein [Candidatus Marinimicrobia bacterium]|nr:PAS domain S-box protein [Candidatus Neomarinimicrobiota bacterium]
MREKKREKNPYKNRHMRENFPDLLQNPIHPESVNAALLNANLPGFVYLCKNDKDWTMLYLSDQCETVTGYKAKDLINNKKIAYNDIICETERANIYLLWKNTIAEKKAFEHEYRIKTAKGEERWVWERGNGVYDKRGELLYLEGYIEDITRRKQTEEKYRILAENTSDVIWTMDLNMRTSYISPSVKALLKEDPDVHIQQSLRDKMLPEDIARLGTILSEELEREREPNIDPERSRLIELQHRRIDGSFIWVEMSLKFTRDDKGKVNGILGVTRNIDERKRAELQLKGSEERYRSVFDNSLDAILLTEPNGHILSANRAACEMFGMSEEEIIRNGRSGILAPDNPNLQELLKQREKNRALSGVLFFRRGDGSVFPAEISNSVFTDSAGEQRTSLIIRDVTERKKSEEALRRSEEKYRLLVENANDGIEITQNDKIIFCNARFAEMLGYGSEEIKNVPFRNIFTESAEAELKERHRKRLEGQQVPGRYSSTFCKKDGSVIDVEVTYEIIDYRGTPATFAIIRDITELKRSQQELIRAKERAEESDRLKSAFLANMSHEIRTPMNGILGFTDLLKNPKLDSAEKEQYIRIIRKSGQRLLNTVNDIIEISKIETGQTDVLKKAVDYHDEIRDLCVFFGREAEQKGLAFFFDNPEPREKEYLDTDLSKFISIVSNLIKNAVKFTREGSVHVGYTISGNDIEIYVSDTGIGIPEERRAMIFDRFVQADITDKNAVQGSGLGLAIAKSYTELLGGSIGFWSEAGRGSRFYFRLPYHKTEPKNIRPKIQDQKIRQNKPNILIAEDDEAAALYLSIILENSADTLLRADTGETAVDLVRRHPELDIVLMDIKMPGMGGYEATKKIREFNKEIIIIAQTAHAFSGESQKALDAGCNGYVSKPVSEETLLKTIAELWNK